MRSFRKRGFGVAGVLVLLLLVAGLGAVTFLAGQKTSFFNRAASNDNQPVIKKVQLLIFNPILKN